MDSIKHQFSFWKLLGLLFGQLNDESLCSIFILLLLFLLFLIILFFSFLCWWWGLLLLQWATARDIDVDNIGSKAFNLIWVVQVNNILTLISFLIARYLAYLIIMCVPSPMLPLPIHYKVLIPFVGNGPLISMYQLVGRIIIRLLKTSSSCWVLPCVARLSRKILLVWVLSTIVTPSLVRVTPHSASATTVIIGCSNAFFRHTIPNCIHFLEPVLGYFLRLSTLPEILLGWYGARVHALRTVVIDRWTGIQTSLVVVSLVADCTLKSFDGSHDPKQVTTSLYVCLSLTICTVSISHQLRFLHRFELLQR